LPEKAQCSAPLKIAWEDFFKINLQLVEWDVKLYLLIHYSALVISVLLL